MLDVPHQGVTEERGRDVPDGSHDNSPQLAAREAGPAGRRIIGARSHAARIGEYLSHGNEKAKCDRELKPDNGVESGAEAKPANRAEQGLPGQWIMIVLAGCPIE